MPVALKLKPQEYEYEVVQNGVVVASAWGLDKKSVLAEACHYAVIYAQDGPVELRIKPDHRKRKPHKRRG